MNPTGGATGYHERWPKDNAAEMADAEMAFQRHLQRLLLSQTLKQVRPIST